MSEIRILGKKEIEQVFNLRLAVEAVENAYREKNNGQGGLWPMVFHEFVHGEADLDIKSGDLGKEDIFGLKLVSWFGANEEKKLPALFGTSLIFDRSTGEPKALLNAGPITDLRTGAAGAIGVRLLARKDSRTLLMVGTGVLSPYLIASTLYLMPGIEQVELVNPHHPEKAFEKIEAIGNTVDDLFISAGIERSYSLESSLDLEEAVRNADVILTATPSYEPMIKKEWVKTGTHFSCVGSDMSGKEEIDPEIFTSALVYGDDKTQCLSVGECEIPQKEGKIRNFTEIGELLNGKATGRISDDDITIFDSTGIALQDLASAAIILREAEKRNLGTIVEL